MNRALGTRHPSVPDIFQPGGYLTLVSGTPQITSDQTAKTVVFYTPDRHAYFPVIKNGIIRRVFFEEVPIGLTSAHAASSHVDVFGVEINGRGWVVTGPAWSNAGTGVGSRGTGGGTTELVRNAAGLLVNKFGIPGLNANGSAFIPPQEGTYLGSLFIDGSNGQVSCHHAFGQTRKWGVWNYWNQRDIVLQAGDSTASWAISNTANYVVINSDANNHVKLFQGFPDSRPSFEFELTISATGGVGKSATASLGIGIDSSTVTSGLVGSVAAGTNAGGDFSVSGNARALHTPAAGLGLFTINALQKATVTGAGSVTGFGGNDDCILSVRYRG